MPKRHISLRLRSEIIGVKRAPARERPGDRASGRGGDLERLESALISPAPQLPVSPAPQLPVSPPRHTAASAAAKLILCGEHAVVYGRPAIALPLASIRAHAEIADGPRGSGIVVHARDQRRRWRVADDPAGPLSQLITSVLTYLEDQAVSAPDLHITISSTIPIASGMGSGAAVATAVVRALTAHLGRQLTPAEISALVYTSEQRFHGTPSGIDNTVIAYEQAIWFQRQSPLSVVSSQLQEASDNGQRTLEPIVITTPFTLLIGETGIRSATRLPVSEVRRRWQADPARYETLFDQVGALVTQARAALAQGDMSALGALLNHNHMLLQQIGISSRQLDALVGAAIAAGALGAKLSGAGWGGVMLALVTPDTRVQVAAALEHAGAKRVSATVVNLSRPEATLL